MGLAADIYNEIRVLTQHMTEANICLHNQFPATRNHAGRIVELYPANSMDLSSAMRNVPYAEAYDAFRSASAYNMVLADGAMIHFRYLVKDSDDEIVKHNIGYWPSPRLLSLDQAPWIYEEDEPFGDAIDARGVLPVPIRIDFAPEQFVEHQHPRCHATLGQYPNCRIAVSCPVRPGAFLNFVLRNFYFRELSALGNLYPFDFFDSPRAITNAEAASSIHFVVPRTV